MYNKNKIKAAGKIFKSEENLSKEKIEKAIDILTYWRTIHGKALTSFEKELINISLSIDDKSIIAKRLKRTPSIVNKLKRLNHIQLNTMQDIAGIRVVVSSMAKVRKLIKALKSNNFAYELKNEDDYITKPKESGYRSYHLIFKNKDENDKELDGLLIEVQVRTFTQHIWATAVEIMGTYLNTHLKFNEGQLKWKNYFALTSNAFAYLEKTNKVPQYSKLNEIDTYTKSLYEFNYNKIESKLSAFSKISDVICDNQDFVGKYNLIMLDILKKEVNINVFSDLELANTEFTKLEKQYINNDNYQIALVATENIQELKDAYPNYFLDTRLFMKKMSTIKRRLNNMKKGLAI